MTEIKNRIIRKAQEECHLYGYQVARLLNVSEATFGRMLRFELPEEEQTRIANLIMEACNEKK